MDYGTRNLSRYLNRKKGPVDLRFKVLGKRAVGILEQVISVDNQKDVIYSVAVGYYKRLLRKKLIVVPLEERERSKLAFLHAVNNEISKRYSGIELKADSLLFLS